MTKGVGSAIAMSCRHLREDLFLKIYVRRGRLLVIALVFFILFAAGVAALEFLCLTDSDGNLLLWKDRLLCYRSYALVCMTATVALMLLYVAAMEKMASGAEPRRGDKYGEKPHAGRRDAFRADKYKEALSSLYDRCYEFDLTHNRIIAGGEHFQGYGFAANDQRQTILDFCQNHVHPDDRELYLRFALPENNRDDFEHGVTGANIEYRTLTPDGASYRWKSAVNNVFTDPDDLSLRSLWFISDITDEREKNERLSMMAERDSLTGLYNKTRIREMVEKEIESLGKTDSPAAMIMVDLDNFKNVNDLMGHLFGDAVLVSVAQTLRGIFTGDSLLGRAGGDEFVVFLPGADANAAQRMAEEACLALSSLHRNYFGMLQFSASIGVALFPQQGKNFLDLYNKADIALYHSKNSGKARCQLYKESMGLSFAQMGTEAQDGSDTTDLFAKDPARHILRILYNAKDTELAVCGIIELIVRRFNFSRGYIFRNSDDGRHFSEIYEFCNDGVAATKEMFQNRSYEDERPDYRKHFNDDGIFWMEIESVDAELFETFDNQNIHTLVQTAVMDNGDFIGFLGFDCYDPSRVFSKEEKTVIEITGQVIASFIVRNFLYGGRRQ